MTTLKLNDKLLSVLMLIQQRKALAITESELNLTTDWLGDTKKAFFALPDTLCSEIGLIKNNFCFNAIERLSIPGEWLNTDVNELDKFEFSF